MSRLMLHKHDSVVAGMVGKRLRCDELIAA